MSLICPGSSTSALALQVTAASSGKDKLDPKLAAILNQCNVRAQDMDKLGDGDCLTIGVFARVGLDEKGFMKYMADVLGLNPQVDGTHAIPAAKHIMAWDAAKKRTEVEIETHAQRAAHHLPPQLAVDDYPSARLAFEKAMGREFDDHKLPSRGNKGDRDFATCREVDCGVELRAGGASANAVLGGAGDALRLERTSGDEGAEAIFLCTCARR